MRVFNFGKFDTLTKQALCLNHSPCCLKAEFLTIPTKMQKGINNLQFIRYETHVDAFSRYCEYASYL